MSYKRGVPIGYKENWKYVRNVDTVAEQKNIVIIKNIFGFVQNVIGRI